MYFNPSVISSDNENYLLSIAKKSIHALVYLCMDLSLRFEMTSGKNRFKVIYLAYSCV